jgi:Caspase domain/Domain of unknown function (DUF4384)
MMDAMRAAGREEDRARFLLLLASLVSDPAFGQGPPGPAQAPERPCCAALLPAVQAAEIDPASAPRRRALLVGIGGYTKLGGRNGDWPDLPTRCDVEVMRQALVGRYAFAPEQVKVLTEGEAERQKIIDLFRSHLIQGARPGDVVVFYFSGHGQRIPDPRSWGGLRGSLVTADYIDGDARNGARTNLRSDTLRDLLRELKAQMRKDPKNPDSEVEGNITDLLDSCYSGGGTKGLLKPKGRAWDPAKDGPIPEPEPGLQAKGAAGFFDKDEAVAQGYVLVAASRSEQPALAPAEGTEVSLMTYHLAELLAQAPPRATYRDVFERLSVVLSAYQNPQLEGRSSQRLFAAEGGPGETYLPVQKVEGNRVTLPVGRVQGVTKGSRFALYRAGRSVKDPKNKVAEVEVEAVRTTTCVAAPTAKYAAVDPKELETGRAVEVLHNYGEHRLRVLFGESEPPDKFVRIEPPAGLLRGEGDVLTTEGATPDAFDVRARREGRDWVLERPSKEAHEVLGSPGPARETPAAPAGGLVLTRVRDDGDVAAGLRTALVGEWRYQFLARRLKKVDPEGALDIEVKLLPWVVEENDQGEKVSVGPRDEREPEGQVVLRPGDYVAVFVRNIGTEPVYVTVLDLGTDGSIKLLFPPQDAPPIAEYAPARVMPGKGWERLRGQVVQLEKPPGQELFKVIATKQPADFSGFLYIPPGAKGKGDEFEKIPAKYQPLGLLMDNVMAGRKGNPVSTAVDWCTAEGVVEVRLP